MNFQEITEKEYTSFLNNHPLRTFLHTPNIAKMRAVDGWEHIYLGIKNNNKFTIRFRSKYIKSFNTYSEALLAIKLVKINYIKEKADRWRGQITEEVYQTLIN